MIKIITLFTGGTICSSDDGSGILSPDENKKARIIEAYREANPAVSVDFECRSPFFILSENIEGEHFNALNLAVAEAIEDAKADDEVAGIIVLHGTDTLQYSVASVGLCQRGTPVPVIFVATNYILEDPRSNALANMTKAVDFISKAKDKGLKGCYAAFDGRCIPSLSMLPHLPYDNRAFELSGTDKQTLERIEEAGLELPAWDTRLISPCPVLFIKPLPGQLLPVIPAHVKAVLLDTYHSGTVNTADGQLGELCDRAKRAGVKVYVLSRLKETHYESEGLIGELGICSLPGLSPVAAYMLLWYMFSV